MVIFDQLRISDDGKKLFIDVHVSKASYYTNVYLKEIRIMTADKVSEGAPELFTEDYVFKASFDVNTKEASIELHPSDFNTSFTKGNFSNDLFFVYVTCQGTPDECTPCDMDNLTTVGVVFDENILYQDVMSYTKQFVKECSVPSGFIDFILLWNAFKASVETEHYVSAIKYYNMLFGNSDSRESRDGSHSPYGSGGSISTGRRCRCHG